jgi:hypothetical protein
MLRNRKISVGKYYVNNARNIAREVLACCDKTAVFITHHLDTGNSCNSPSECLKRNFINWADHEATPAEMAKLQTHKVEAQLHAPQFTSPQPVNSVMISPALEFKRKALMDQQSP